MKKIIFTMALASMLLMGIGNVAAQPVDIGTGQMEASEFAALKAMVQGQATVPGNPVSTPVIHTEQYGELQMTPAQFQSLKNAVAGKGSGWNAAPGEKAAVRMIDIGTGEMPADEFYALKQMVEGAQTAIFDSLAFLGR